ncbi:hypothetical protein SVIO_030760 [Streptomyces violaceusniger]|uniref:Glycoside hydrolase 35 catalytic domain-containing protein n=1 Tax=Streptomyces violaceusniger TaxID=68280 RepID=A0A4D4L373_STRVO|nr:hypothetical protein SVIO_030760 [Streptomyces violaceusniger]
MPAAALTLSDDGFLLHGEPFRILSGALHYFRTHPDQWADRLRKARLLGLNTVETYVPWNLHQPAPGTLDLDGLLDLPRFLELAHAEGLRVLLRPGPYICAEWEGGGLPSWLTAQPGLRPRSRDPRFTAAVDAYLDLLLPPLAPHMAARGGPVIAVQVENEYGAYGDDTAYLAHLADALRTRGVEELLFTCDQANTSDKAKLTAGSLPGVLSTGTFGGRVEESLEVLRAHQESGPLMCAEFWIGWFDHWGEPHHVRSADDAAAALDTLLSAGASVNIYMFHGGTNFGFTAGANHDHAYTPPSPPTTTTRCSPNAATRAPSTPRSAMSSPATPPSPTSPSRALAQVAPDRRHADRLGQRPGLRRIPVPRRAVHRAAHHGAAGPGVRLRPLRHGAARARRPRPALHGRGGRPGAGLRQRRPGGRPGARAP